MTARIKSETVRVKSETSTNQAQIKSAEIKNVQS